MVSREVMLAQVVMVAVFTIIYGGFCFAQSHEQELRSLLEFKKMVEYDPTGALADWLPFSTPCNWSHIHCNSAGRVVKIYLYSMQIQGTISPSLGNLSHLNSLDLCNNSFHGPIPPQLGRLKELQILYLCINSLQGTIPETLTNLTQLQVLSFADNNLHGNIPHNIGLMSSIKLLTLQMNNLSGPIPSSIGNLSSLGFLAIYQTNIVGTLPQEIGKLNNLRSLMIFNNPGLTGAIPESICNMSALTEVDMHQNAFTGYVPSQLGMLKNLSVLYLRGNSLTGNIPPSLGNCTNLGRLDFDKNQLTGVVPPQLGRLTLLRIFSAMYNRFASDGSGTVSILSVFSNCSKLESLKLSFNNLTGILPSVLPRNLTTLKLDSNRISGPIPWQTLSRLGNLINLDLSGNELTGGVSGSVGDFKKIQRLALGNNKLQGNIPSEIGRLSTLYELSIPQNFLQGGIPGTIGNLKSLRHLVLNHNYLSGTIPSNLGDCYKLELLDLAANKFEGVIPPEVANLYNIQIYFNLSSNSLHGRLPTEIGQMIHALAIDVSANRISGMIPASLESCSNLQFLNLSFNEFEGSIPRSLSQLGYLLSMDLSHNKISGPVPFDLEKLQMLQSLNLSFNDLSGQVPKGGSFPNFTRQSFLGNPQLCGEWVGLPACILNQNTGSESSGSKVRIIAPLSAIGGASVICILVYLSIYSERRHHESSNSSNIDGLNFDSSTSLKEINYGNRFSYGEISEATERFSRNNLLVAGILASVYKGILRNGTEVAIKLLKRNNKEALKTFLSECKALGMVKHRNLVKLMGICWEDGHRALVMQFMPNRSLAEALKRDKGGKGWLTFRRLLSISMDVAHGLEYLHHHCSIQIVHCDIKPSNILFDEDMVAHVADFGIARLLCTDSTASISSTLALVGSIGYIPPEYGGGGMVSTKGDVYSFGIMLLEMVTGRSPTDLNPDGYSTLHSWVQNSFPDRLDQVLDKRLTSEGNEDKLLRNCISGFVEMALCCSNETPFRRPQMNYVSGFLEEISQRIKS